jgi:hypothetical protein
MMTFNRHTGAQRPVQCILARDNMSKDAKVQVFRDNFQDVNEALWKAMIGEEEGKVKEETEVGSNLPSSHSCSFPSHSLSKPSPKPRCAKIDTHLTARKKLTV